MTDVQNQAETATAIRMEIDHRAVIVPEGITVLRAAELSGVYIPSLCSHKDLTPFGGCRMCVVEIEGMRGYSLSCSTKVQEGMKVLTDTATLREMRKEILQMILSEHPSSCLVCGESDECKEYQFTIRKVGVTTGCRYCPNDGQCELQEVVEKTGLTAIDYPIYYRGFEAEHDDPFFDRDYNICILCGRCVRMCQEVRGTSILAFKYRGPKVRIGPAFGDSHVDGGCEFCGACVSVCPTGALADKSSKWDGKPDEIEISTCPFCGLGCRIELHRREGRLSKVHPNLDPEINDGQLCVRGRFCMPETIHHHDRARKPMLRRGKYFREVSWTEAIDETAARLKGLAPEDFLMLVSGDITNESIYAAGKFVRTCMGSGNIDSTAGLNLPGGLDLWKWLFSLPISISGIAEADTIIAVGLDSRFYFSVAGVQIRRALKKGARLAVIDARDSNLSRYTDHHLRPLPGLEGALLDAFAGYLAGDKKRMKAAAIETGVDGKKLEEAAEWIGSGERLSVIAGPAVFGYSDNSRLIDALLALSKRPGTSFLPLYHGGNVRGALELGAFGDLSPGKAGAKEQKIGLGDIYAGGKRPKVIYLVGQAPFAERPDCDFLISQDMYRPPFDVDVFLPAAGFAECGGTMTNVEGRVQELYMVENTPEGDPKGPVPPDWKIFAGLADKLGCEGLGYADEAEILAEIHAAVPGFPATPDRKPRRMEPVKEPAAVKTAAKKGKPAAGGGEFLLVVQQGGFQHRSIDLSGVVEGLGELRLETNLRMNRGDLERLGVESGAPVTVSYGGMKLEIEAQADPDCPEGAAYAFRPVNLGGLKSFDGWKFFQGLDSNPARVSIEASKAGGA